MSIRFSSGSNVLRFTKHGENKPERHLEQVGLLHRTSLLGEAPSQTPTP